MISFLTNASTPTTTTHGDAYVEALTRLETLRRSVDAMDTDSLEVKDMPGQVPSASHAEQVALAEQLEAAARDGLAAATAAARTHGKGASTLADSLRQGGVDLHRILSL